MQLFVVMTDSKLFQKKTSFRPYDRNLRMIPKSIMENGAEERVESVRIYSSKCAADVGGVMWTPVVLMETMRGNVWSAGRRTSFVPLPDLEPSAFCQRVKERFTRGSLRCRRSLVPGKSAPLCDRLKEG